MTFLSNEPLSLQYARIGEKWVLAEAEARHLEDSRTAYLSQRMLSLGDMPVSKAEMMVKGSQDYRDYLGRSHKARTEANQLKIQLDTLKMMHSENINSQATERFTARL